MSDRRKQQRQKRKAAKEARMRRDKPEGESFYAMKRRGIFPKNSPYVTEFWGRRMRKLEGYHPVVLTPEEVFGHG